MKTPCIALGIIVLLAGCVSSKTHVTGVPFLTEAAAANDPEGALRTLAQRIVRDAATLTEVRQLLLASAGSLPEALPPGHTRWEALIGPQSVEEQYTWRFAVTETFRYGLAVTQGSRRLVRGYQLVVAIIDGRVVRTRTEATDLTDAEREWMTTQVISLGTAAVGTLWMLKAQ